MNMNLDLKQIPVLLKQLQIIAKRYSTIVFIVSVLAVYSFLVWQIGALSNTEPTDEQVEQQLKSAQKLKINQRTIDKINQLQDHNIAVKSLFQDARDNPFQEKN